MAGSSLLSSLPPELLHDILERLHRHELLQLTLASRWCYEVATPIIWRDVELKDRSTYRGDEAYGYECDTDEHDDTPLIRKLLILAQKPWIAKHVHTITHRCHLPPPGIFHDLPKTPFTGQTLSSDPRTVKLVQLAIQNMPKVHTLRIIFGHLHISDALIRCLFDKNRVKSTPVRRLWLENCHISAANYLPASGNPLSLPRQLDFHGLESIRFRRLPMRPQPLEGNAPNHEYYVNARGSQYSWDLQDGAGRYYSACVNLATVELSAPVLTEFTDQEARTVDGGIGFDLILHEPHIWNDEIYHQIEETSPLPQQILQYNYQPSNDRTRIMYRSDLSSGSRCSGVSDNTMGDSIVIPSPAQVGMSMLKSSCQSLTSVCLDWVLTIPDYTTKDQDKASPIWLKMYLDFFTLRFPHLKALQFRNNVVRDTKQPEGLYLLDQARVKLLKPENPWTAMPDLTGLDDACLSFMEAHKSLQCLAWPMETFFSGCKWSPELAGRIDAVIDNLSRTLVDLRVDTMFRNDGEPMTDSHTCQDVAARQRRRCFIEVFASRMTKLESIKVEGGVPRDERKEIVRALHRCPLKKIVMIGVSCPVGNTWGAGGKDLGEPIAGPSIEDMEGEDKEVTYNLGLKPPASSRPQFRFEASYGWSVEPPMILTIASFHRDTVTELKFCGYQGSPILFTPTPITRPLLAALKYFDKLESLILSTWLSTIFEGSHRDLEIIGYWLDARSPNSTSLVRTIVDEEPQGWEKELRTKFAPPALAWQVTSLIGPFLSEQAKARKGGVHVRISICIGDTGGIFDMDLNIGKGSCNSDVCLRYKGPREELEPHRRRSKLESRRWF